MAVQFSGVPVEFFHSDVLVHIVDEPDTDGVADSEENNVPPLSETAGDGNGDHIADSTQENVASLHNATDGDYATVAVPDGMRLVAVSVTSPDEDSALADLAAVAGADFPQGLVGFRIEGLSTVGETVTITEIFHTSGPVPTHFYKYNPAVPSLTEVAGALIESLPSPETGYQVSFDVTDGGPLDADGLANGVIVDPGGPAIVRALHPLLTLSLLSANQAQISWPLEDGGAVLQSRTNLGVLFPWEDVTNTVVTNGDIKSITIDLDVNEHYFRLAPPSP